jgi:hypothetical protein
MSEEQSGFKVTDRRLFNSDGTPRETVREEERESTPSVLTDSSSTLSGAATESTATRPVSGAAAETSVSAPQAVSETRAASAGDDLHVEDETDPNDPASFVNFLMSVASNAASALGMMEHPVTGERGVELEIGKHWIDVLGMLQRKTRSNLNPEEQQILEGILSDLRMQYVALTGPARRTPPSGFTAGDILGSK